MMKRSEIGMLLVVLLVMGTFSGAYANKIGQDNSVGVNGGKTIYVAKNGTDRNDGLTPEKPKRNLINAINDANPGDTIRIGPGTYQNNLQINKNITLIGDNQNNTIIDGQRINSCIRITGVTVTIIGFTIKNGGYMVQSGPQLFGGGIYNEGTLTIKNSTIRDDNADSGGGIYNLGIMNISNVIIKNNNGGNWGGGGINNNGWISIEDSAITDNIQGICNGGTMNIIRVTIKNNNAEYGGGIFNWGKMVIEDSVIRNNTAKGDGGGIDNTNLLYVYGSTFTNNKANNGGGIFNFNNSRSVAYMDDITILTDNYPNNFEGVPFIPA